MKTIEEIAEQIAINADMHCEKSGWQRIDLKIACYRMVKQIQRWISVEEEFPPIDEVVLFKTDFNFIVGFYTGNNKFRALTFSLLGIENLEINNITHW